jgi:hypothetical protein
VHEYRLEYCTTIAIILPTAIDIELVTHIAIVVDAEFAIAITCNLLLMGMYVCMYVWPDHFWYATMSVCFEKKSLCKMCSSLNDPSHAHQPCVNLGSAEISMLLQ